MPQTYYYHQTEPDVRIKVCKKTVVIERNRPIHYDSDDAPKQWHYYTALKLPLKSDHAETLREKYNLPADVVAKLV